MFTSEWAATLVQHTFTLSMLCPTNTWFSLIVFSASFEVVLYRCNRVYSYIKTICLELHVYLQTLWIVLNEYLYLKKILLYHLSEFL